MKTSVFMKNIGIHLLFDKNADSWEITLPAKFGAKTEGLCGMADGDATNDFWVGSYSISQAKTDAVSTFFNHWLVTKGNELCYSDALESVAVGASFASANEFCHKVCVDIYKVRFYHEL